MRSCARFFKLLFSPKSSVSVAHLNSVLDAKGVRDVACWGQWYLDKRVLAVLPEPLCLNIASTSPDVKLR